MRRWARRSAVSAVALTALLLTGCQRGPVHSRVGRYVDPGGGLFRVNRVVLVPLTNETDYPDVEKGMTDELFRCVQSRRLFHLEVAQPQGDTGPALPAIDGRTLTVEELAEMRRSLGADAVLIGNINQAHPYPRLQVGLYLRLLDLRKGRLLWAVDHTWDATDEHTQRRLEMFFKRQMDGGPGPYGWELGTLSPGMFRKFVAWEVADTLPHRPPQPLTLGQPRRASPRPGKNTDPGDSS